MRSRNDVVSSKVCPEGVCRHGSTDPRAAAGVEAASLRPRRKPAIRHRPRQSEADLEEHLFGHYRIEVIDLLKTPRLARDHQIVAIPTLVRQLPSPLRKILGDAELRRAMPATMVVVGDGPLRGQVRATVERLGLTRDVHLLGRVPFGEIRDLYDSASVFLFTSLRDSFGGQVLEALGRGLPTVALDHHGVGDADVGPAIMKVALPPRPGDLPGHIARALANRPFRYGMGGRARQPSNGQANRSGLQRQPSRLRYTSRLREAGAD